MLFGFIDKASWTGTAHVDQSVPLHVLSRYTARYALCPSMRIICFHHSFYFRTANSSVISAKKVCRIIVPIVWNVVSR